MKSFKRMLALLLTTVILMGCVFIPTVTADAAVGDNFNYTKKIVSVVYDDSTSMKDKPDDGNDRYKYAEYAMQTLMALLSKDDTLIIVPMNDASVINVDLANTDRNKVIDDIIGSNTLYPDGSTPAASVVRAVEQLTGLDEANRLTKKAKDGIEHWLVVLTDGEFSGREETHKVIKDAVEPYQSLKTIYLGMGKDAPDLGSEGIPKEGVLDSVPFFFPYMVVDSGSIISAMKDIANKLSGRYTLDPALYEVDGSKVTIDLSKAEFAFDSISVIAQNCGATLTSVVYKKDNKAHNDVQILNPCVIVPKMKEMDDGYSAVLERNKDSSGNEQLFSGGTLELLFDKAIKDENVSILAEPALEIKTYLDYYDGNKWQKDCGMQYINATLKAGTKIKVRYEIFDRLDGQTPLGTKELGKITAKATYAGQESVLPMGTGEAGTLDSFVLKEGSNMIAVSVSVMGGVYSIYSSLNCTIEKEPKYFRVEGTADAEISYSTGYGKATYTAYSNNKQLTAAELSETSSTAFKYNIVATDPNGDKATCKSVVNGDGTVTATIYGNTGVFGEYNVEFIVTRNADETTRSKTHKMLYKVPQLELKSSGPTELDKKTLNAQVIFTVEAGGKALTKDALASMALSLKLTKPDGTAESFDTEALKEKTQANGNILYSLSVNKGDFGEYKFLFTATPKGSDKQELTHVVSYYPDSIEIKGEHTDVLPSGETTVTSKFSVLIDGVKLNKEQLEKYNWEVTVVAPGELPGKVEYTVSDDGITEAVIDCVSAGYGKYQVKPAIVLSENFRHEQIFPVSNYPKGVTLVSTEGGGMSISEHQLLSNQRVLKFELTADGTPFVFNNGLTTLKVTVGNKDVTQYVVIAGNILSYAPLAEHFGGELPVGQYTLTVKLDCPEATQCATSASAKFSIHPTKYEIKALDGKNTVDRFRLSEVDAVLYFAVLRDGELLPFEELKAAYEKGEIKVTDQKGKFGWQFWLPCGKDIKLEKLSSGEAVIAFRVTKDWIKPFDSYAAMLIFNGDNPINVSYKGASLSQNITFKSSPVWSYIWRILVILLIIHTTLYIIGFFNGKCKSLPSGTFVMASPSPYDGNEEDFTVIKFNSTWVEKYMWHLWRFLPYFPGRKKLWYNQPDKSVPAAGLVFKYSNKGAPVFNFLEEMQVVNFEDNGTEAAELFDAYRTRLRGYKDIVPQMDKSLRAREMRNIFRVDVDAGIIQPTDNAKYRTYYGTVENRRLTFIVFFIPHN